MPKPPMPIKFTSLNNLFTILTQLPIKKKKKSIFKTCKANLKLIPSFAHTVQFWVDLKAWRTMLNRTTLFGSALYFRVALRASKR
jgi:hypothetical protein